MINQFRFLSMILLTLAILNGTAQEKGISGILQEVETLREAYPDTQFTYSYNQDVEDFELLIQRDGHSSILYRADGSYLTKEQLLHKDRYRRLLYPFPKSLADPADFTDEELERVMRFGSTENRRSGRISGTGIFDALYGSGTREDVERHIISLNFLGRSVRVHSRLREPLENVEKKIRTLASHDEEAKAFLQELGTVSGYSWRSVRDTSGKSFHSMGLAMDIMPENLQGKAIYWNWEKNKGNDQWMLIPLTDRWMPPENVIRLFESEGFIWGGMWPIWDNMHFEYRPELLLWREKH